MLAKGDAERIVLAQRLDFQLGSLQVSPSTRQAGFATGSLTLEPRVMQVLVALNDARGRVVSRDLLVQRCWDGRIVGDSAINRVILQLRHLAADAAAGSFAIETIARVGYRLVVPAGEDADAGVMASPPIDSGQPATAADSAGGLRAFMQRRRLLGAGVVLGLGGLAAAGIGRRSDSEQQAAVLVQRAVDLDDAGLAGDEVQALAYLEEAVSLVPDSAEAWGALALAHVANIPREMFATRPGHVWRAEAAARTALELDSDNADAKAALVLRHGGWGRWATYEADCRAILAAHPVHKPSARALSLLYCEVGRWRDALVVLDTFGGERLDGPRIHIMRAQGLAATGRLQESDRVLAEGIRRWPGEIRLWTASFEDLIRKGRTGQAQAMANDEARIIFSKPPMPMDMGLAIAAAIESGQPADRASAVDSIMAARERGEVYSLSAVQALAALRALDEAFSVLELYLFGGTTPGGNVVAAPDGGFSRSTNRLFLPSCNSVRADPRFAGMMQRVGLADYWRRTRSAPQLMA